MPPASPVAPKRWFSQTFRDSSCSRKMTMINIYKNDPSNLRDLLKVPDLANRRVSRPWFLQWFRDAPKEHNRRVSWDSRKQYKNQHFRHHHPRGALRICDWHWFSKVFCDFPEGKGRRSAEEIAERLDMCALFANGEGPSQMVRPEVLVFIALLNFLRDAPNPIFRDFTESLWKPMFAGPPGTPAGTLMQNMHLVSWLLHCFATRDSCMVVKVCFSCRKT